MLYFMAVFLFISHLHCSHSPAILPSTNESSPLLQEEPVNTVIPIPPTSFIIRPTQKDIRENFQKIQQFLNEHPSEFPTEYSLFQTKKVFNWKGYVNPSLLTHINQKITSRSASSSSLNDTYTQLLNEFLLYSQSHNEQQKEKIGERIKTLIIGTLVASTTSIITQLIAHHMNKV